MQPIDLSDRVVVGIDNGLGGALAAIRGYDGSLIEHTPMPLVQYRDKKEPNIKVIYEWIVQFDDCPYVGLEEPLRHARSSQAMRSMSICYGMIKGMLIMEPEFSSHMIQVRDWQSKILGKTPRGQTKEAALALAQQLEPGEKWLKSPRATTPSDGAIDAYLIARYLRGELSA